MKTEEVPAWSWPRSLWQRLTDRPHVGRARCDARWCFRRVFLPHDRFCEWHHDAMLELYGARVESRQATVRLDRLPFHTRRRIRIWADSVSTEDGVRLVALDYVPPAHEAPRGIVTG